MARAVALLACLLAAGATAQQPPPPADCAPFRRLVAAFGEDFRGLAQRQRQAAVSETILPGALSAELGRNAEGSVVYRQVLATAVDRAPILRRHGALRADLLRCLPGSRLIEEVERAEHGSIRVRVVQGAILDAMWEEAEGRATLSLSIYRAWQ